MSQSLDGLVEQSIQNAIQSGTVAEKVQKAAEEAIESAISAAFGYRSEFRKGIEAAITQVLPVVNVTDLANFTNATRNVIQQRLGSLASETAEAHLGEVLDQLLPDEPVITLEQLREAFDDKVRSDASMEDCSCEDPGDIDITWEIEESGRLSDYWDLVCAPEPDTSRYCGTVTVLRFKLVEGTSDLHECWHVSDRKTEGHSLYAGPLYGFDAMVFRLATGVAKLKK